MVEASDVAILDQFIYDIGVAVGEMLYDLSDIFQMVMGNSNASGRVKHLARYAKKRKTRKKNWFRVLKSYKDEIRREKVLYEIDMSRSVEFVIDEECGEFEIPEPIKALYGKIDAYRFNSAKEAIGYENNRRNQG